jgi:hypothetical protein
MNNFRMNLLIVVAPSGLNRAEAFIWFFPSNFPWKAQQLSLVYEDLNHRLVYKDSTTSKYSLVYKTKPRLTTV